MPSQWYVRKGDRVGGPFSKEQLVALAEKGKVTPASQVRNGESGPWRSASDVPGLFPWIDEVRPGDVAAKPRPSGAEKGGIHLSRNTVLALAIGGAVAVTAVVMAGIGVAAWLYFGRDDGGAVSGPDRAVAARDSGAVPPVGSVGPVGEPPPFPSAEAEGMFDALESALASADAASRGALASTPVESEPPAAEVAVVPEPVAPVEPPPAADENEPLPPPPDIDPKPLLPPVPAEKTPIADREISEFLKRVRLERKAADAYAYLLVFSQSHAFTETQQPRVDAELAEFKTRADGDLHRLGNEWVPLAEVEAAEKEAEQLMERAATLIEVGSFDECISFLEDASRTNPNGIQADYILGLLQSLPFAGVNGPDQAEKYFRRVLARQPDHPGALNSLAIAQIKQRDFSAAVTNLSRAAELTEQCQEVSQNLGRFIFLVQSGRVQANSGVVKRYTDLYSQIVADKKANPFSERTGWLHMVPVFAVDERHDAAAKTPAAGAARPDLLPVSRGTGFVVAHEHVLTNRHVVCDDETHLGVADAVGIIDPRDPQKKKELRGSVVAVSDKTDLALVRFPGLQMPPVPLFDGGVELASEVMILGYPRSDVLGEGLKATRGIVSGVPDPTRSALPEYYLFDATSDRGNSGGPVLNRGGAVVGVLTAVFKKGEGGLHAELSAGVTVEAAVEFLREHLPNFAPAGDPPAAEEAGGDWSLVTRQLSPSVFQLTCYYRAGVGALNVAAKRTDAGGNVYEDYTCPDCTGRSRVRCPQKGCVGGEVSIRYTETVVTNLGSKRTVLSVPRTRKGQCPTCGGAATVDCAACSNGVDRALRKTTPRR